MRNMRNWHIIATLFVGAGAVSLFWSAYMQREEFALQTQNLKMNRDLLAEQKAARKRIHGSLDVATDLAAEGLFVRAKYENRSAREIHLWMLGVRIFKASGFVSGTTVKTKPELLLYSDSSIDECPETICPPGGTSADRFYTHPRAGGPVSLGPWGVHQELFGPYAISDADLKAGVWIQAFAYPRESDDDICVIVEQPSVPGAFPRICEATHKSEPECWASAKCPYERAEVRLQRSWR
jgi:hypothetical protein